MKRLISCLLCCVVSIAGAQVAGESARGPTRDVGSDMATLSRRMPEFMVKVYAMKEAEKPGEGPGMSTGSGELIRSEGGVVRIITNAHVVGSAETVYVHFDGQQFAQKVRVIGRDQLVDLALLEVPVPLFINAKPIALTQRDLAVGQSIYAMGYPSGSRTISAGFVNSLTSPHEEYGIGMYFTHQAPISPGSSGGSLVRFTPDGREIELVGINTQVEVSASGLVSNVGYSIKHDVIARMLPKLEAGLVEHALAGIVLADTNRANPYAYELGAKLAYPPSRSGIMVVGVIPGTPAHRAGLKGGDIIRKFEKEGGGGWEGVHLTTAAKLRDALFFDIAPGTVVRMTVVRGNGEETSRTFTLERFPDTAFNPKKRP